MEYAIYQHGHMHNAAASTEDAVRTVRSIREAGNYRYTDLTAVLDMISPGQRVTTYTRRKAGDGYVDREVYYPVFWYKNEDGSWTNSDNTRRESHDIAVKLEPAAAQIIAGEAETETVVTKKNVVHNAGGMRYVKGAFDISGPYGKKNVDGWIVKYKDVEYGVRKEDRGSGEKWSVTHVPTGMFVSTGLETMDEISAEIRRIHPRVMSVDTKAFEEQFAHTVRADRVLG